ncbi:hypothetical protein ACF0H5_007563 [Mactra antiquata]
MDQHINSSSTGINETGNYDNVTLLYHYNSEFTVRVLPVSVVFGLTACLGFLANILVVYVYGLKYKQCNFKYFLFVMGLIGLVQCTIMLPTQVAEMHYWFVFPTSWLCRVSAYIFGYTVINCYFVLLLIALDRFRKVCRPYDWQIQPGTAKNLCITVSVASLVFAAPPGIISGHHRFGTSYNDVNITVTVCATDDMYLDRDWAAYFLLLFGGLPVSIVILVTCILYGLILRQFYLGPAVAMRSLYGASSSAIAADKRAECKQNILTPSLNGTPTHVQKSPELPAKQDMKKSSKAAHLKKIFHSIIPGQSSIKTTISTDSNGTQNGDNLRTSRSNVAKSCVRKKLMRKTLIVLIITITCIVALIITFCLHLIAESINRNALTVSAVKLNAFVIFHRGSFSIICAIFPIIYGTRDPKFRKAFLEMFRNVYCCRKSNSLDMQTEKGESKC